MPQSVASRQGEVAVDRSCGEALRNLINPARRFERANRQEREQKFRLRETIFARGPNPHRG